jgi:6-pyruvoyltetrahydropterin/6-carboxytetrahydropterin synthase
MDKFINFSSNKLYDGYSTCFRQWKADGTHCKYLHGYGISFRVWFEGELDERNWVFDFGGMKRATHTMDGTRRPIEYFNWLLDHTCIIAEDDPELNMFKDMEKKGIIQLRILPNVGVERFSEFLLCKINEFLSFETQNRVLAVKVEVYENNKNAGSAELRNSFS